MGGSSAISGMLYVRGNRKDYDAWAKLGNTGWSYNEVLPYFKKSEDNRDKKVKRTELQQRIKFLYAKVCHYKLIFISTDSSR